jgi:hypothetical protein
MNSTESFLASSEKPLEAFSNKIESLSCMHSCRDVKKLQACSVAELQHTELQSCQNSCKVAAKLQQNI